MKSNRHPFAPRSEGPDTTDSFSSLDEDAEPGMANTLANDRVREYYRTQQERDEARAEWRRNNADNMKENENIEEADLKQEGAQTPGQPNYMDQDDSDLEGEELPRPQCQIGDEPCDSCS